MAPISGYESLHAAKSKLPAERGPTTVALYRRPDRLKALGVNPSSRLYEFASGPWPFIIIFFLLALDWLAFGLAAKKARRELDDLRRRTQE